MVIETEEHAAARGVEAIATLVGWWSGALLEEWLPPPPVQSTRAMIVLSREDEALVAYLEERGWAGVRVILVAPRSGDHEAVSGIALAAAVGALAEGRVDEALVFERTPGRWTATRQSDPLSCPGQSRSGTRHDMLARPRALLAVAAFALSALAASPAAASQTLACKPGGRGLLSCWDGKLTVRTAGLAKYRLAGAAAALDTSAVVVAGNRACALMPGGALECWGDNESGELGDGTRVRRDSPVRVRGLDDVTAVALGSSFTCALRGSGKVACWGYDDVSHARRLRPSVIPSLDHVVELVAGGDQACARRENGSVWCWGNNHYGQLGDGTRKDRRRPVQVKGITSAVELSAGLSHSCARRSDGSVWCWGNGWGGTDGTDDRLLVPARVAAIQGATALISTEASSGSGLLVQQKNGSLVSCHYQVGASESESSPRLLCQSDKAPDPRALAGAQLLIQRPSARKPRIASAARAAIPHGPHSPARAQRNPRR